MDREQREQQILSLLPMVRALARRYPPPYDDRVQDGWVGAIGAVDRWDGRGTLPGWASQRIHGAIIDGLRTKDGRPGTARNYANLTAVSLDGHDAAAPGSDIEAVLDLRRAIRRLNPRDRRAIYAYYWQDRSLLDIGAEMGVNESRACQRLIHARRLLARHVA